LPTCKKNVAMEHDPFTAKKWFCWLIPSSKWAITITPVPSRAIWAMSTCNWGELTYLRFVEWTTKHGKPTIVYNGITSNNGRCFIQCGAS
jgi:hypothetical protein